MNKLLKTFLYVFVCMGLIGCSSGTIEGSATALEKIEEVMIVEVSSEGDTSFIVYAYCEEYEGVFTYYAAVDENMESEGIMAGDLAFNYSEETYITYGDEVIYSEGTATETDKAEWLSYYDLTEDEMKAGLQAKYESLK